MRGRQRKIEKRGKCERVKGRRGKYSGRVKRREGGEIGGRTEKGRRGKGKR